MEKDLDRILGTQTLTTKHEALILYILYYLQKLEFHGATKPTFPITDLYTSEYKHIQSALTFVLKIVVFGDRLLVHCLVRESGELFTSEVRVEEYVLQVKSKDKNGGENGDDGENGDGEAGRYSWREMFVGLNQLESQIGKEIIDKILPGYRKSGTPTAASGNSTTESATSTASNQGGTAGERPMPRLERPPSQFPPVYGDPLRSRPPSAPFSIGSEDLNPVAGVFGPAGGMTIGPDHPGFANPPNHPYSDPYNNPYNNPYGSRGRPNPAFLPP